MTTIDLCIKNNHVLNVFSRLFEPNVLWINDGQIIATGESSAFHARRTLDYAEQYIVPGFIDAHVHIESSLLTPSELAKVILPQGTTGIFTDPHEIANVAGANGIQYMIDDSRQSLLDVYTMLPSSIPCTPFEDNGATLTVKELKPFYQDPTVRGLAEVMDYPAISSNQPDMIAKLNDCLQAGRQIDGHGSGLSRHQLDVYRQHQISTDHEATTIQQIQERINEGFYVFLREGTVERDLENTVGAVNESNANRFAFCTDDKLVDSLLNEGGINDCIRKAIHHGLRPETAYTMASFNAAQAHQTPFIGALNPNYQADIVVLDDPYDVKIHQVIKKGHLISNHDFYTQPLSFAKNTMNFSLSPADLQLPLNSTTANIIQVIPNHIETEHLIEPVSIHNGNFCPDPSNDQLKMVVVERHHHTGKIGKAIVKGFNLTHGAVASSIAHDSHNIIAVGTNDADLFAAIQHLQKVGGGITVFANHHELATLPLQIGGLMSNLSYKETAQKLNAITAAYQSISRPIAFNPFITLSFLALPVIPTLKLTARGLYDFDQQKFIPIEASIN